MTGDEWDNLARDHANALQREAPAELRGAYPLDVPGVCIAYSTDDYAHDHRARLTVTLLREYLHDAGLVEVGFGIGDEGQGWAMAVQTTDPDALLGALIEAAVVASAAGPG